MRFYYYYLYYYFIIHHSSSSHNYLNYLQYFSVVCIFIMLLHVLLHILFSCPNLISIMYYSLLLIKYTIIGDCQMELQWCIFKKIM